MSISHVALPVRPSQYQAMRAFYLSTLSPLGYKVYLENDHFLGLRGTNGPDFWLHRGGEDLQEDGDEKDNAVKTHVAFAVTNALHVDTWFQNAV